MFNAHVEMVFNDSTDWKDWRSRIHALGPAASNPLGLGPSFIMGFIDSVGAIDVFEDQTAKN
ncbi:hypothetical protein B2J93_1811 [Marssonina coronariae]|uniref:Uncharacterized protein n=1 Tax=Diplocarpon coronariae TaxID=2795749 RepID=A0A218ZE77_9HELO|nr:hypothetical protein B2J93_1811 [Marssonina coronariae]